MIRSSLDRLSEAAAPLIRRSHQRQVEKSSPVQVIPLETVWARDLETAAAATAYAFAQVADRVSREAAYVNEADLDDGTYESYDAGLRRRDAAEHDHSAAENAYHDQSTTNG